MDKPTEGRARVVTVAVLLRSVLVGNETSKGSNLLDLQRAAGPSDLHCLLALSNAESGLSLMSSAKAWWVVEFHYRIRTPWLQAFEA